MDQEQQAVFRLKAGDIDALEYLVRSYYYPAVRTAFLILRDRPQAEDVVQTAFLTLRDKIRQYDPDRPFRTWFLRCVVNASLNTIKTNSRLVSLEGFEEAHPLDVMQSLVSEQIDPEASVEAQELRELVWQALGQLSPKQRAAIVMRYYLGFNEAEMVEKMASPASSVKWWLHSARQRLRELLAPLWPTSCQPEDLL